MRTGIVDWALALPEIFLYVGGLVLYEDMTKSIALLVFKRLCLPERLYRAIYLKLTTHYFKKCNRF